MFASTRLTTIDKTDYRGEDGLQMIYQLSASLPSVQTEEQNGQGFSVTLRSGLSQAWWTDWPLRPISASVCAASR